MLEFKLVSYNIHKGQMPKSVVRNIQQFVDMGVSMFCLQELRRPRNPSDEFVKDTVMKALGPEWTGEFFLSDKPNNPDCGLGIIWRKDAVKSVKFDRIQLPKLSRMRLHQKVFAFTIVRESVYPIQRGCLIGQFEIGGQMVRVTNVHLDYQGGFSHRFEQIRHIIDNLKPKDFMGSEIMCGDFNTLGIISNTNQMQKIQELLGEEFINAYPEFRITTSHHQHLDHVFTRKVKATESKVYQWPGSDHYPILVNLNF